ncbi:hypothetical protein NKH77_50320 [Streptomyces sp. M19]
MTSLRPALYYFSVRLAWVAPAFARHQRGARPDGGQSCLLRTTTTSRSPSTRRCARRPSAWSGRVGAISRPDDRFKRACEIVQQADLEIAAHAEKRNQAAMSILPNAYNEMLRIAPRGCGEGRRAARQGCR